MPDHVKFNMNVPICGKKDCMRCRVRILRHVAHMLNRESGNEEYDPDDAAVLDLMLSAAVSALEKGMDVTEFLGLGPTSLRYATKYRIGEAKAEAQGQTKH